MALRQLVDLSLRLLPALHQSWRNILAARRVYRNVKVLHIDVQPSDIHRAI